MLEGLTKPDGGEARVLGYDVVRQSGLLKERIGVQLQTAALYPLLTVEEVVSLFCSFYTRSRTTDELIEALDLGERRKALTRDLSGGQRQRLSVALALVNDPELIFLDEPTTGLDPQARRSLWDLVGKLRDTGKTVLLTTHYMEEAARLCDRVAVVDHGKVIALGTPRELIASLGAEHVVEFTVGEAASSAIDEALLAALPSVEKVVRDTGSWRLTVREVHLTVAALLTALSERGLQPTSLTTHHATLEDVFMALTGRRLRDG
jgi:ABC-2 type transport system ATP-binding protein